MVEEDEDDSDYEPNEANEDSADKTHQSHPIGSSKKTKEEETRPKVPLFKMKNPLYSPTAFSPISSPKISSETSSPQPDVHCKNEPTSLLRLKSTLVTDSNNATSLPVSPHVVSDCSISSAEYDGEMIVRLNIFLLSLIC